MKVHYKPKMIELIRGEINKARTNDRVIDFIELTDKEMIQFKRDIARQGPGMPVRVRPFQSEVTFMGVQIVKESAVNPYYFEEEF